MSYTRIIFLFFILFFLKYEKTDAGTFSVDYQNHVFLKDGKPFQYLSGAIHYFRLHPDYWDDRLKRIRALGLNVISTYVPWNLHEPTEGNFDFSNGILNLTRFLTLAQQNNLNVLLRPTPYINGEFEWGGFPYWLQKYDGIKLRTADPVYLNAISKFYDALFPVVKPFLYKNGGPILMIQAENEYGTLTYCDHNYTYWLRDQIWSRVGSDVVLYTNDYSDCGRINGTLATIDSYPTYDHAQIDNEYQRLDNHSGGAPHSNSEFYTDWFLYWGAPSSMLAPFGYNDTSALLVDNLQYMFYKWNASINLYLILGSTNFGFWNGQQAANEENSPVQTSYWVNSPILENGDITDKYLAIRSFIQNIPNWPQPPLDVPQNNTMANYGQVQMTRVGTNLISTLGQIQEACQGPSVDPLSFEKIDHPYGFVVYRTVLSVGGTTLTAPNIRDYGYVYLNNVYQGMILRNTSLSLTLTTRARSGDSLKILVENRGRQCWYPTGTQVQDQIDSKGLHGNVTLDGAPLKNWYQCGVDLSRNSVNSLINSSFLITNSNIITRINRQREEKTVSQPGVYVGYFDAQALQDTYFDSTGWGKGQLFINGYNIGRYWPTMGPQMALYIPKPYLQASRNTVLLIELAGTQQNTIQFIDHPVWEFKN